ncbi:UbiA-like protein EboC [Chitinophaga rhizosphaerae]|uniref:UbiA-like protein EboC n=1 Tax=Chitinophaga rhizosphaerae TaxID=1864947 RepID=UPI001F0BDBED|nr:UbiA-like protein EboC [Chitinophaga rhizosphaerae]
MNYILSKLMGYLRLMRPANILTAITDIIAGAAIVGFFEHGLKDLQSILQLGCLVIATIGLYGGGVVFNDVFDAKLDKVERPERPIPSGVISITEASVLGGYLLVVGILAAFTVSNFSGWIAVLTAVSALVYDKWAKHHSVLGPLLMGVCRGLNLSLGMSVYLVSLQGDFLWWIAVVPVAYIAAVTMISRDEVHGGTTTPLMRAAVTYALVIGVIGFFSYMTGQWLTVPLFLAFFAWLIYKPLLNAMKAPTGPNIGKSVKWGVLGLIAMNAAWTAAFAGAPFGLAVLAFLPLSIFLGKLFAVT